MVVKLGMRIVLEELIKMLEKYNEDYLVRLRNDLKLALGTYEDRYNWAKDSAIKDDWWAIYSQMHLSILDAVGVIKQH